MNKQFKVVGAIIENENSEILCALRGIKMKMPGLWEFPGGKVEKDENIDSAIEREIKEELGCEVKYISLYNDNIHEYEEFVVNLITVKCKIVKGVPIAREHDKLIWLKRENLLSLNWAPADVPAVKELMMEV